MPLFRNIHHNPEFFTDPQKFDPSRFEVTEAMNSYQIKTSVNCNELLVSPSKECVQTIFNLFAFLKRFMQVAPKPNTFMPFGSGLHACPGNGLAKLEILIMVHHLVTNFRYY